MLLRAADQPTTAGQMGLSPAEPGLPILLISDGRVLSRNLKDRGLDRAWLLRQLKDRGFAQPGQVFCLSIDETGTVSCVPQEGTR